MSSSTIVENDHTEKESFLSSIGIIDMMDQTSLFVVCPCDYENFIRGTILLL